MYCNITQRTGFVLALLLFVATSANAQESATANVSATVQDALTVTNDIDVSFGNVPRSSTPILVPIGTGHTDVGTSATVGQFTINGTPSQQITVSYTASTTLGDGASSTLTFTPDVAGHEDTQGSATAIGNPAQVSIGGSGAYMVWVGGNIGTVGAGQTTGLYSSSLLGGSGDWTLTVEYF